LFSKANKRIKRRNMTKAQFIELCKESVIYAIAKAEENGVSVTQITLWLNSKEGKRK